MRNLKKILSLALALMMILSVTASAAFTDAAKIDADYAESATVLNDMGIFQGYEDGSFRPTNAITRAEVAAIVYRIATADVQDEKVALYVDSTNFPDVKAADWFSGYVGYCTNAGYIKGYEDGTFKPLKTVTGFETLAMILRAMGYDAENEFSGAQWSQNIAKIATKAGMLNNVKPGLLAAPATREMVAELLFAGLQATTVKFVPAWGYIEGLKSLGEANFELAPTGVVADEWGRPSEGWSYLYDDEIEETLFAKTPKATYYTAVTECEVAAAAGVSTSKEYTLFVNAGTSTTKYTVDATDTVTKLGAQGRKTEVYSDRIVMVDTFLAEVTSVSEAAYDALGHLKTPSKIVLKVWDAATATENYYMTNGKTNYTYVAGDMVLINAYTGSNTATVSGKVTKDGTTDKAKYAEIAGKALAIEGAQSIIYTNAKQHNVNGTIYFDSAELHLDEAGASTAKHTWYFDNNNNLIGATDIASATSYGVITNIWWAGSTADGSGLANATVTYMDGTTGVVTINKMSVHNGAIGAAYEEWTGKPTYSTDQATLMTFQSNGFRVSTDAKTNATYDTFGIVADHLFKFTTSSDGTVAAYEVAGSAADTDGLANVTTAILKDTVFNTGVMVGSHTKFLVRSGSSFAVTTGYNNIVSYQAGEVDYVDLNKDGTADYVYIIADPADAQKEVLFYYAGGQIEYAKGVWTVPGYIDGVAGTILVKENADTATYLADVAYTNVVEDIITAGAHNLYLLQITNGYVETDTDINPLTAGAVSFTGGVYANAYANTTPVVHFITGAAGDKFVNNQYVDYNAGATVTYGYSEAITKVVGEQLTSDMSEKDVIVVWNNMAGVGQYMSLQMYVVDSDTTVTPPPAVNNWTASTNAAYEYNMVTKQIYIKSTASTKTIGEMATDFGATATYLKAPGAVISEQVATGSAAANYRVIEAVSAGYQVEIINAAGTWTIVLSK